MEATRKGSGARPMRVTQVGALYDWEAFFAKLEVAPHSHVQTHAMTTAHKEACHVFRFFRRDSVIAGGMGEAVTPHSIFEEPPAADDIILVTKHLLSSQEYAAPPQVFCPGSRFRALYGGPAVISGRVQFSARQQKEFLKTARVLKQSPWNMSKADDWLTALVDANKNGFSPTWVAPTISWVVSDNQVGEHPMPATPPSMPRALPAASPVPVTMEDKRRRLTGKQPRGGLVVVSKRRRACLSQRDCNLSPPSIIQSVAGAPLAEVSENGAPENVAAPPVVNGRRPASQAVAPDRQGCWAMSVRLRNQLLRTAEEPTLGCSRCRRSAVGCATCRRSRDCWRELHRPQS